MYESHVARSNICSTLRCCRRCGCSKPNQRQQRHGACIRASFPVVYCTHYNSLQVESNSIIAYSPLRTYVRFCVECIIHEKFADDDADAVAAECARTPSTVMVVFARMHLFADNVVVSSSSTLVLLLVYYTRIQTDMHRETRPERVCICVRECI